MPLHEQYMYMIVRTCLYIVLTELLFNFLGQKLHFSSFPMHEHDMFGLALSYELHDAFGVCVRAEAHVLHRHLHFDGLSVELEFALTVENLPAHRTSHTVARHDDLQYKEKYVRFIY